MIIGLGQNLRRCPGARLGLPGRTNICGVIPQGEDRAELWALAEGPHARLSLSSCKAGPAFSAWNLCLTPAGWKVWVALLSLRRDGHTRALEVRSFRGGREIRKGKNKAPGCFCCSFPFHADHSVVNRTSLLATVCICSFSKNFSPHLSRAGWCRGIWKRSLCLLLASSL